MAQGSMLEREGEVARIGAVLDEAVAGRGSLMVAEGPAGIGKSTLLEAAVQMAADRGMGVLRARGGVLEQRVEFGIVRQLVEREVVRAAPAQRERLLGLASPAGGAGGT
ncbi:MAG: AAA family ATPase [Solirubrobacterales bacterium]